MSHPGWAAGGRKQRPTDGAVVASPARGVLPCWFVASMVGRVIASSLACFLAACGTGGSRPPPLLQEQPCPFDGSCVGPPINHDPPPDGQAPGDAGSCLLGYHGALRSGPAQGKVVVLGDPKLDIRTEPHPRYYGGTPISSGSVMVEIEVDGCALASAFAKDDGTFSIEGTAESDVSVRLVPINSPDLITTIHHLLDDPGAEYPILTRAALDGILATLTPAVTPEPDKSQVIVNFVLNFTGAPLAGATFTSGTFGTLAYDGDQKAGPLGYGAALNGTAMPYPGNHTTLTIHNLNGSRQTVYVAVAQDAVSLIHVEP